jgi:hypothetical protein
VNLIYDSDMCNGNPVFAARLPLLHPASLHAFEEQIPCKLCMGLRSYRQSLDGGARGNPHCRMRVLSIVASCRQH